MKKIGNKKNVAFNMAHNKSPGPDGFSGAFLKACSPIIKHDFNALIPKTNSPKIVNDYRLITLLDCCLKLLTKLLANRLQHVILQLIHMLHHWQKLADSYTS